MKDEQLLANASVVNRSIYQSKQIQSQLRSDRAQEQNATILGYNSTTGQFRVRNEEGKIFYCASITNSGALNLGSQVSLNIPVGGTPIIDAIPR